MNVYTCTGFTGRYPTGTAAVVVARGARGAVKLLNAELRRVGLDDEVTEEEMWLVDATHLGVEILCDGNY